MNRIHQRQKVKNASKKFLSFATKPPAGKKN